MIIAIQRHSHVGFRMAKQAQSRLSIGWPIDSVDLEISQGF